MSSIPNFPYCASIILSAFNITMMVILGLLVLAGLGRNISDRMATVLEEKIRGLFKDFKLTFPKIFWQCFTKLF